MHPLHISKIFWSHWERFSFSDKDKNFLFPVDKKVLIRYTFKNLSEKEHIKPGLMNSTGMR
jgi:hypothetical protein